MTDARALAIESMKFDADERGQGLELRQLGKYDHVRGSEFVLTLFNDHAEAWRYVTRDEIEVIRDWCIAVLKEESK